MSTYTHAPSTLLNGRHQSFDTLVRHPGTAYGPSRLRQAVGKLGHTVTEWLAQGTEPRITHTVTGDNEIWKVYDPTLERTLYFSHEDEVRAWLDQRFYQ